MEQEGSYHYAVSSRAATLLCQVRYFTGREGTSAWVDQCCQVHCILGSWQWINREIARQMGGSTKCFPLEDKGPMCPRQGRNGRTNRCAVVMLQGLIIELWRLSGCGGRERYKCSSSLNQLENWMDRRQRGKKRNEQVLPQHVPRAACRLIRSLEDSALCQRSFLASA